MSRSDVPASGPRHVPSIELPDAALDYRADWVDSDTADAWLQELILATPWTQPEIRLYGRQVAVPRLVAWYGDSQAAYRYSGLQHEPLAWTPLLQEVRQRLERETGHRFNGVLINLYRDGGDAMGWHSDDEVELGRNPVVASLSLGAERRFDLRRKGSGRIQHSLLLGHGSLLVMSGATQHHWQHQIARTSKVSQPRLNLTFRLIHRDQPHEQ
jgi:alkylated DNA repair dioxygenase AlkB